MKTETPLVTGASSGISEATAELPEMTGLGNILAVQRAAFLRDGSASLAQHRSDLNRLKQPDGSIPFARNISS